MRGVLREERLRYGLPVSDWVPSLPAKRPCWVQNTNITTAAIHLGPADHAGEWVAWLAVDPKTHTMGDARGALDRLRAHRDAPSVLRELVRIESMPRYEERAHCVCAGLAVGVFRLAFGHETARTYDVPDVGVGCPMDIDRSSSWPLRYRPIVTSRVYSRLGIDVLPELPAIEAFSRGGLVSLCDMHLDDYFAQVADRVDRRSLLLRKGGS